MFDRILIDFYLAPHLFGDFEGFGGSKFVSLFEDALHEEALPDVGLIVDDSLGEGLAGLVAADTAVHLGQVVGDFKHLFHLAQGDGDIVIKFVHRAGLHFAHGHVVFKVILVIEDVILLWGDSFGALLGAFSLPFGDEESVAGAEDSARTAFVAGTQL